MKLKLDAIQAKYLPFDMKGHKPEQPVLKIIAGEFEATTSRVEKTGEEFHFPEAFQIDIDEEEYQDGKLILEVEAYDFATQEYVYIGKGQDVLKNLVPGIDSNIYFIIDLAAYEPRFEGPRKCEILMRGVVTNKDPLEEELLAKIEELAAVKQSYEEFVLSAKKMEDEMEAAMEMAQQKIDKLSKKNKDTVAKLNALTADYNANVEEINRLRKELEELRRQQRDAAKMAEANSAYAALNEELTMKLAKLTASNEELMGKLSDYEEEKASMQTEMDELYTSRYEMELRQTDRINELMSEIERLREQANDSAMVTEMAGRIDAMNAELLELRANAASNSIMFSATYITNTNSANSVVNTNFYESIVNSTNESNVYITNILKSGDVEKIREALVNQLRLYDELKVRNAKLLNKVQALQGNITVCCRTRPPSEDEINRGGKMCVDASNDTDVYVYHASTSEWAGYEVDCVWGYDHNQVDVFADIEPLLSAVVHEGADACVMAYGDAGTGKSFTISGFGDYLGIAYRTVLKLFDMLELCKTNPKAALGKKKVKKTTTKAGEAEEKSTFSYSVEMSVMSLHCENAYDLILSERLVAEGAKKKLGKPLEINYDTTEGVVDVPFLLKVPASNPSEAMLTFAKVAAAASDEKGLAPHTHLVLDLYVTVTKDENSAPVRSKMSVIDLASMDPTLSADDPANKGLNSLVQVMAALEKKTPLRKVPYQASKLTTLLQPVLTPPAALEEAVGMKAMMVVTLAPTHLTLQDTVRNLEFAAMVRGIKRDEGATGIAMGSGRGKGGPSASDMKNLETKLRNVRQELADNQKRFGLVEKKLTETKHGAAELIGQLNEYNDNITAKYQDEKEQSKILASDLELTQRNMKKTLDQLKEQIGINERMVEILKIYETELAGSNAVAENSAATAAAAQALTVAK